MAERSFIKKDLLLAVRSLAGAESVVDRAKVELSSIRTHAVWGMRVVFVPDDEVHESPRIEVRQSEEEEPST
jgi:hypothetical protein